MKLRLIPRDEGQEFPHPKHNPFNSKSPTQDHQRQISRNQNIENRQKIVDIDPDLHDSISSHTFHCQNEPWVDLAVNDTKEHIKQLNSVKKR